MDDVKRDKARAERVTKFEAAQRQLCVAIRLFFQREDTIAVHTLAAAAQQIFRVIGRDRDVKSISFDEDIVAKTIRPEYRQRWYRLLVEPQNFFKHADRDPDVVLKFYPETTRFHLFDAALMCHELDPGGCPEASVFIAWMSQKYSGILADGPIREFLKEWPASVQRLDDFESILAVIDASKLPQKRSQ